MAAPAMGRRGCWIILLALLLAGCQPWRTTAVVELNTAVRVIHDPRSGDARRTVDLPDEWPAGTGAGSAVYQVQFASSPSLRPQALLIARAGNFVGIRLNGRRIAQLDQPPSVLDNPGSSPVMLYLPDALLRDENLLEFHITGRGGAGAGLSRLMVGPENQIERLFALRWSLSNGLLIVMLTTSAFVLLFAMLLWRGTRDRLYLALAASAVALAGYSASLLIWEESPIGWPEAAQLMLSYHAFIALMGYCAFRMLGIGAALVSRLTLAYWTVMAAAALASAATESMTPYAVTRLLSLALVVYGIAQVVRIALAHRTLTAWLLIGSALLGTGYALRDLLGARLGYSTYGALPLQRLVAPAFMFTVIIFIVEQYTRSYRRLRRLNATLEQRVADAQEKILRTSEALRQAEKVAAVEQERRRLMQDIHDGLGGQLVATLSLAGQPDVGRDEIVDAVETCITELRVAIDSLEPFDNDLLAALGTLRARVAPLLARSAVQLTWRVTELPSQPPLSATGIGDLFRLLIEVFTNVVKHSGADRVALRCAALPRAGFVWVSVSDNGRGLPPPERRHVGRGLANMRERAARIGAQLSVRARPRGTQVRLVWQLAPSAPAGTSAGPWAGTSAGTWAAMPTGAWAGMSADGPEGTSARLPAGAPAGAASTPPER